MTTDAPSISNSSSLLCIYEKQTSASQTALLLMLVMCNSRIDLFLTLYPCILLLLCTNRITRWNGHIRAAVESVAAGRVPRCHVPRPSHRPARSWPVLACTALPFPIPSTLCNFCNCSSTCRGCILGILPPPPQKNDAIVSLSYFHFFSLS